MICHINLISGESQKPIFVSSLKPKSFFIMSRLNEAVYCIPARYRRMENMHIAFWLMKDISWCMLLRELGIAMIIPTLSVAIWISWRNRQIKSELAHNLAIVFWISANAYWMISEFFEFDTAEVWKNFTGKHFALIPFSIGAFILLYYYIVQRPREEKEDQVITI
jgi:hypothetical protein